MKPTSHWAAAKAVSLSVCVLTASTQLSLSENTNTIPAEPVGWLTAYPTVVQTGTKPFLTWEITHPAIVGDYVEIIPPSTVNPTDELDVEVRVLGNGVTVSSSNSNSYSFVDAQATISFDGGSYKQIFYGDNYDVNPSKVVWERSNIQPGQKIRFGGRYYYKGYGTFYYSEDGKQNVRTLVDGSIPPTNIPSYGAPSLEDFIAPYIGSDGRVDIGPMDVIVFMELTHTDSQQSDEGYDLQDLVLLVTFTANNPKNNDSNDADDIDSSSTVPFMEYDSADSGDGA
ncbi:hypothetical protein [Luteolibacter sp. AS25]|uniref:hypothetical protein n=1 Tax=Luteolibacter sp. AS25 TaxID=3135776 RepID=UPI00398B05F5